MTDNNNSNNIAYIDEERVVALRLSVQWWGMVAQSAKANPTSEKTVLETADRFYAWLVR
jgi:hypothetical protein